MFGVVVATKADVSDGTKGEGVVLTSTTSCFSELHTARHCPRPHEGSDQRRPHLRVSRQIRVVRPS